MISLNGEKDQQTHDEKEDESENRLQKALVKGVRMRLVVTE
jgi:hypothetical protein